VIGVTAIMPGTIEVSVLAPTPALRMSALERLQFAWWARRSSPMGGLIDALSSAHR
jgi:hypothetical protein